MLLHNNCPYCILIAQKLHIMTKKGILVKIGKTGRGTEYKLAEINPKNTNETRNKHER